MHEADRCPNGPTRRTQRLADRLAAAQRRRFVGRRAELELFSSALHAEEPPFAVLHIHGPGGVGKSALLREYAHIAAQEALAVVRLDGRGIDPSPIGFVLALREALGLGEAEDPLNRLGQDPRAVLLLDTYEMLAPLDEWLRQTFLPQLPEHVLVAIAGRNPPDPAWMTDPGWNEIARVISLRNLRPEESRTFLVERRVPAEQHAPVLQFTHGHPLALSLVADAILRNERATAFRPDDAPDVVRVLLERFVVDVPSPRHRRALEICAHARFTTEPLLDDVAGADDAHELFEWLRGLPFIEQGPDGLFPHDLAREVLDADLRWRDPAGYADMHRRVWLYLRRRMRETAGRAQQQVFFDKIHLHRGNSVGRRFHDLARLGSSYAEPASERDHAAIVQAVRRHEGEESARIAAHWLRRQPEAFLVLHDTRGDLLGFVATLVIDEAAAEDVQLDPALGAAWTYARQRAPVRAGEQMIHHRFHLMCEGYQEVSPVINLLALSVTLAPLRYPRLAWSFVTFAQAEPWLPITRYINFERAETAEFTVGGRRFAVFAHDWRVEPFDAWWEVQAERSIATDLDTTLVDETRPPPLLVLSEPEFRESIRQALRDLTRPRALAASPLLRSRLVVDAAASESTPAALRSIVREAIDSLRATPRSEKFYRALFHTYVQPAQSQERAADRLGLPFTTYRYQLARGTECVADWLWQRELYGACAGTANAGAETFST
ncbi:MAG: ATP-binding protein [Longimicrobiales bacterium]